jgi:hypothetical protein
VLAAQEVSSVRDLTYDKSQDSIRPTTAGLVGTRPIDWQNRPTFQQVVGFSSHRPRAAAAAPPSVTSPPPPAGGQLPATGPVLPGAVGLLTLLGAVALRRVRSSPQQ